MEGETTTRRRRYVEDVRRKVSLIVRGVIGQRGSWKCVWSQKEKEKLSLCRKGSRPKTDTSRVVESLCFCSLVTLLQDPGI